MNKILRDRYGRQIGTLVTQGRKILLRGRTGTQLGTYTESDDTTRNRYGSVIGKGNLLTLLLAD